MTHRRWCARGHRCGLNEHRTIPLTLPMTAGPGLTLVRVANDRGEWLEIRTSVPLALDRAEDQIRQLVAAWDLATEAVLTGDLDPLRPMLARRGRTLR